MIGQVEPFPHQGAGPSSLAAIVPLQVAGGHEWAKARRITGTVRSSLVFDLRRCPTEHEANDRP